jgi:uncharacterized protein YuzB (UPF0349 family)
MNKDYEVKKQMRRILIEFCISNLANGAQKAREILERDYYFDIAEYGCLSNCGKCRHSFYALVDGVVVMGETSEQLVENIYLFVDNLSL